MESDEIDGHTYWFAPVPPAAPQEPFAYLLSIYDEYVIGYGEWNAVTAADDMARLRTLGNDLTAVLILNGHIAGTWKRKVGKREMAVTVQPFRPLAAAERQAVAAAAERYGGFFGLPVTWG